MCVFRLLFFDAIILILFQLAMIQCVNMFLPESHQMMHNSVVALQYGRLWIKKAEFDKKQWLSRSPELVQDLASVVKCMSSDSCHRVVFSKKLKSLEKMKKSVKLSRHRDLNPTLLGGSQIC